MPTVRGHEYGKRFPAESPHEVIVIPEYDFHRTLSQFMPYRSRDPIVLGRDVFRWIPIVPADSLEKVAWLMVFYDGVAVIGYIGMKFGGDQKGVETFKQIIRKKGSRERYPKRIADRGLVTPPPDDVAGFLRGHRKERKNPFT